MKCIIKLVFISNMIIMIPYIIIRSNLIQLNFTLVSTKNYEIRFKQPNHIINTGLIFQYVDVTGWKFNVYILLVGVRWDLRQMFLWFSECTKLEGLLNPIYLLMTSMMTKVVAFNFCLIK